MTKLKRLQGWPRCVGESSTVREFGRRGRFRVVVAVCPDFSAALVRREGLVYATRYIPALAKSRARAMLYLLLRGRLRVEGRTYDGPAAVLVHEAAFEGLLDNPKVDWVNVGEPLHAIELRFRLERVRCALGSELSLPPIVFAAADAALHDAASLDGLVDALTAVGVLAPSRQRSELPTHQRLWSAARPLAANFNLLGSLDELAEVAGVSARQIARDIGSFTRSLTVPFDGWRDSTRRLRLKMGVMALSAPDLPIGEVARAVGYGSMGAMSRAFRDAGLPVPSDVRDGLAALSDELR